MTSRSDPRNELWAAHDAEWRAPQQVSGFWAPDAGLDPRLLHHRTVGPWWDLMAELSITLLVTREYEHLAMAMCVIDGRPLVSYLRLPHPSGVVADRATDRVFIASTRNPNQVVTLEPADDTTTAVGRRDAERWARKLVPVRAVFLPGGLYLHDLALVGGILHANAVGQNAVVRLTEDGRWKRVWWPRCIESDTGPRFDANYLQLNSIAAGRGVASSFFSASAERPSRLRPGHRGFPVDRRGVIFSGRTREAICRGLTRPHSARLHDGTIWVANSGYGEIGAVDRERFEAALKLPGWTRGLCLLGRGRTIAFAGTSRVLPRFLHYAPGVDPDASVCGVHAIDLATGRPLAALIWPDGNQTFAIDWLPAETSTGFPFRAGRQHAARRVRSFFYSFRPSGEGKESRS